VSRMESSVAGVIVKVGTDFNHSDIMTKNPDVKTFKFHAGEIEAGLPWFKEHVFGIDGVITKHVGGMWRNEECALHSGIPVREGDSRVIGGIRFGIINVRRDAIDAGR